MRDLIKVAIRNVGRNKRRTAITMLTVFIGCFVSAGTRGLLNGLQGEIRSGLTRKLHGDLQIHKQGYQDSMETNPFKNLIPFDNTALKTLQERTLVTAAAPRLKVMALLNHQKSQTSTPVMVTAIDSRFEHEVCPRFAQSITQGQMLDSTAETSTQAAADDNLEEATGLDESKPVSLDAQPSPKATGHHQILVTASMMRGFGAQIGDEVVLLISDKNNMQQAMIAQISGVVDVAMPGANPRLAWVDLNTLSQTLGLKNEVSEVALRVKDEASYNEAAQQVREVVSKNWVVETWLELGGFLRDAMALQDVIFSAVLVILFTIVISAIVNTSLMTVMERTREIGTLMALGYRRKHIMLLFLAEAAVIGISGGFIGLAGVIIAMTYLSQAGLTFVLPGQSIATVLYPYVTPSFLCLVLGLAVFAALGASIVPAYRASRMKPVDALSST